MLEGNAKWNNGSPLYWIHTNVRVFSTNNDLNSLHTNLEVALDALKCWLWICPSLPPRNIPPVAFSMYKIIIFCLCVGAFHYCQACKVKSLNIDRISWHREPVKTQLIKVNTWKSVQSQLRQYPINKTAYSPLTGWWQFIQGCRHSLHLHYPSDCTNVFNFIFILTFFFWGGGANMCSLIPM